MAKPDAEVVALIRNACGYMVGESADKTIAAFYGVTPKEVASIRRNRPTTKPMFQHKPVEERSIKNDEARDREVAQRCESHLARLWQYYENAGSRWGLSREEYCALVNALPVTRDNVNALKLHRRGPLIG